MRGDINISMNTFARWIEAFNDGLNTPSKNHYRIPSCVGNKRIQRRWRRHLEKQELQTITRGSWND